MDEGLVDIAETSIVFKRAVLILEAFHDLRSKIGDLGFDLASIAHYREMGESELDAALKDSAIFQGVSSSDDASA